MTAAQALALPKAGVVPAAGADGGANPNVASLLQAIAAERPNAPAVLRADGSVAWTPGRLAEVAARRAAALADRGVGPGDAVLVLARGEAAIPVVAGVLWSGAAIVVPPRGLGVRSALRAALALRPRAIVASPALW